jgi:hypothetical protein
MTTRYIRAPRLHEHVLITPTTTVRHGAVSYRARGILNRLLSNADGYGMTAEALSAEGSGCEGRDAIRTALRELRHAGYIERTAIKNDGGRFGGVVMYVYDTPKLLRPQTESLKIRPRVIRPLKCRFTKAVPASGIKREAAAKQACVLLPFQRSAITKLRRCNRARAQAKQPQNGDDAGLTPRQALCIGWPTSLPKLRNSSKPSGSTP